MTRGPEGDRWAQHPSAVSSSWMDASHTEWFRALHQQLVDALDGGDVGARELRDALRCVALIEAGYASAEARGAEVPVLDGAPS